MRIEVLPEARDDLLGFLRRAECLAEPEDEGIVVVQVPAALGDEQARMEVDLYLKAWQVSHPDVEARLVDPPRTRVGDEAILAD